MVLFFFSFPVVPFLILRLCPCLRLSFSILLPLVAWLLAGCLAAAWLVGWLLVGWLSGCWLVGCWLLAAGCWLLDAGWLAAGWLADWLTGSLAAGFRGSRLGF